MVWICDACGMCSDCGNHEDHCTCDGYDTRVSFSTEAAEDTVMTRTVEQVSEMASRIKVLEDLLRRWVTTGEGLGGSHPHLGSYYSHPQELWEATKAELEIE